MFRRYILNFVVLVLLLSPFGLASLFSLGKAYALNQGDALWAKSTVEGQESSFFYTTETDSNGDVYAVGWVRENNEYNFGNGVTVTGNGANFNAVIVKYNSSGNALWARSTTQGPNLSRFYDLAVDPTGNVYVVGQIYDNGVYGFGDGVTVQGSYTDPYEPGNALIVKYNSSGKALWARSTTTAPGFSDFGGVATDSTGNVYAVGTITGNNDYSFSASVTVKGNAATDNPVLIKYSSTGDAVWAKSVETAPDTSQFNGLAVDPTGNIYVAGFVKSAGNFGFGNGVTVAGKSADYNVLAVKYNSSGVAQWARSTEVAPDSSGFSNIAIDAAGNFYATGYIINNNLFDFGNNTTVSGAASLSLNALLVKYNAEGKAQWARSTETAGDVSEFGGVATDAAGNVYVSGNMSGTGTYGFGNGVTVAGKYEYDNNVLVKYNPSGTALWARSATKAPDSSCFFGVTTDAADNVYVAGYITGNSQFDFGNGVTTTGAYSGGDNALLVKYAGLSTDIVYQNLPGLDKPINIEDGDVITVPLFTIKVKPYSEVGISKVEFYVDDNLLCTSHTSDKDGVYSCKWDTTKYQSTIKIIAYNTLGERETIVRTASVVLPSTTTSKETTAELTVLPKTGK